MIITYNGETLETKNFCEVSPEEQLALKSEYYERPPTEDVKKQIKKLAADGVMNDKLTNYYFKDLMAKVKCKDAKWTIEDTFDSPLLLGVFKAKTLNNPKVFPPEKSLCDNILTAIRLGGKGYVRKPTKFPIKMANFILEKYNINNNWFDFSCGWGDRLVAALKHNINYYGVDPNCELVPRLVELEKDWKAVVSKCNSNVDIKCQGSEIFIPELKNKIGLAFSSPPYFDLEDYKIGKQSYTEGTTYEQWKTNYLFPTLNNIKEYLITNGILAINIKNVNNYNLCQDVYDYCVSTLHLSFEGAEDLKNNNRMKSTGEIGDSSEKIFIFKKDEN